MKALFINSQQQLRNGWWIVVFIALLAASRLIYAPTRDLMVSSGLGELWIEPLGFVFILAITWGCCRLRNERLTNVGLSLSGRSVRLLHIGLLFGCAQIAVLVGTIWLAGGVQFSLNPHSSVQALTSGFYVFLCAALMEELLFRGFVFQRLIDGLGNWPALIGMGVLFSMAHWTNPDFQGDTLVWASLDMGLGAILWGLAYIRTGSLALPIGMHLGWNWLLGSVFGMGVSGYQHTGVLLPTLMDSPSWLTGGNFGPEASVAAVAVDAIAVGLLWRWKGSHVATHPQSVVPAAV
ncbi:CPBP family intramembrane metalloprotease [Aestuariibacter halophilus]|uniref:CPBP family intramembrane metalloprotease n=1 Tax=Fluctibacter halophilus TaxID=226011 RepID=A0ABS8GC23_9ALTE|nr:type II CAAX endopeptidase family protein [Aestuariibacter halophilus]MCC2617801.1 CPBP family intramembrane metalloprotease [Aestuariibacter halophilus]